MATIITIMGMAIEAKAAINGTCTNYRKRGFSDLLFW
jgi:hypothetical protein